MRLLHTLCMSTTMTEPMDVDSFQSTSDAFLTWLKGNGASVSPKVQLADLRDRAAGRGVVATQDLAVDEELFSIPRTSILTVETSNLPENVRKEIDDPWLSLIITMVYEYLRGAESPWKAYFGVLPEDFDTLMFWSEEELRHLQGSAVADKIGRETADTNFTEQLIPIIAQHANAFKTGNRSNNDLLSLCHRMGSTIMAYAFDLEKSNSESQSKGEEEWEEDEDEEILPKGMVPLADLLNAEADRNNAKLFYENDKVVMKTIKAVRAGEELYNDFGPLPRADLLRRYGYVTENYAKYDVVEISSDLIKEQAKARIILSKELDDKWAYLEEQGVLDDAFDIGRAGSEDGQFPEELTVLLNLLTTPTPEFDKLKKKDKLPKSDLSGTAKDLLRTILVHRYAQYSAETIDESASGRTAMARQVVEGEKQVLKEAIQAVAADSGNNKKRAADTLEEEAAAIRNPLKK